MGLDTFRGGEPDKKGIKWQKPKLHKEDTCPDCGESQTEKKEYYWRCKNSSCETLTYLPNDHYTEP